MPQPRWFALVLAIAFPLSFVFIALAGAPKIAAAPTVAHSAGTPVDEEPAASIRPVVAAEKPRSLPASSRPDTVSASLPESTSGGPTWTYCQAPGLPIPDNAPSGVSDAIVIPESMIIRDVNVGMGASHSWVGDLVFSLTHEDSGTSVTLIDRPGVPASLDGCGYDDIDAQIDDEATSPVEDACAPDAPTIQGSFRGGDPPDNALLGAFNDENMAGTWTLTVSDHNLNDVGVLNEWCLFFEATPAIQFDLTVGTDPGQCATANALDYYAADPYVTYCYNLTNLSPHTLTLHSLVDSELGSILTAFPFPLAPGASVWLTQTALVTMTTVSSATWTAYNPGGPSFQASDKAGVYTGGLADVPLICNGPPIGFGAGIPAGWTAQGDGPVIWSTTDDLFACDNGNISGGYAAAACADADHLNPSGEPYAASLLTNSFDLSGVTTATLTFNLGFRSRGAGDYVALDVYASGLPFPELRGYWQDNVTPGEQMTIDLSDFAGDPDVQLSFQYSGDGWDWFAHLDEVALSCAPKFLALAVTKTVGTDPNVCATTTEIAVEPGTRVYYCYTIENTGNAPLVFHEMQDDVIGPVFIGSDYLLPGEGWNTVAIGIPISHIPTGTTTSAGFWRAYDSADDTVEVFATSTTVTVWSRQYVPILLRGAN